MAARSASRPGPVGAQFSTCRVHTLDAGMSAPETVPAPAATEGGAVGT